MKSCSIFQYTYDVSQFNHLACLNLCDIMDCSTPGFPVHHQLPELAQTHVHRVGDVIQPSHPLLSPSPPQCHWPRFNIISIFASSLHLIVSQLTYDFSLIYVCLLT